MQTNNDGGVGRGMKAFFLLALLLFVFFFLAASSFGKTNLVDNGAGPVQAAADNSVLNNSSVSAVVPQVITIQDNGTSASANIAVPVTGGCADPYTIQSGDLLSAIAARCDTTVAAIRQANPQITNVNLVYVGQQIRIPGAANYPLLMPVTGGSNGQEIAPVLRNGLSVIPKGTGMQITGLNFPTNSVVNIAIGPQGAGYTVISAAISDASGTVSSHILMPDVADKSQSFVVTLVSGSSTISQAASRPFYIGE